MHASDKIEEASAANVQSDDDKISTHCDESHNKPGHKNFFAKHNIFKKSNKTVVSNPRLISTSIPGLIDKDSSFSSMYINLDQHHENLHVKLPEFKTQTTVLNSTNDNMWDGINIGE